MPDKFVRGSLMKTGKRRQKEMMYKDVGERKKQTKRVEGDKEITCAKT